MASETNVVTRRVRADLVDAYTEALKLVRKAEMVLADASPLVNSAGGWFVVKSRDLLDRMGDFHVDMQVIRTHARELKTTW
ncbi:hypothetical protein ORV05_02065 [Amycolatopsis cynarae]|uniref:Uncharacterized protein n=1 Tax=Amycolatopsis cynarae TaxID=2995223 RepID=A0ABY7B2U5_9PSEU|nr:hypothetical protein [Amycolatopsis sp. HUAS 11-8]WAL66625.1 hypothetical protein ORV05_02065 [Amycolatopsis sp. HUAS 11-8]